MFAATLFLFLAPSTVFATSEDAVFGHYAASQRGYSLSFDWDEKGIHTLRINGRVVVKNAAVDSRGVFAGAGLYEIDLPREHGRQTTLKVLILLHDESVKAAVGIVADYEMVKVNTRADTRVTNCRTLMFRYSKKTL